MSVAAEVEKAYEQRDYVHAMAEAVAALDSDESGPKEDSVAAHPGAPRSRAERRRDFRLRRRRRGSKVYNPEPRTRETAPSPCERLTLPGKALYGVPAMIAEPPEEIELAATDHLLTEPEDEDHPEVDEFDEVEEVDEADPELLAVICGEDAEDRLLELPTGFHVVEGGGRFSRRAYLEQLARGAQVEPDWGDPEQWDFGRHEPTYLIARA